MQILSSWDDGAIQDVRLAELLEKYKIPAIFYWPAALERSKNLSRVGKFLTINDCKQISKKFSIGSHGYYHQFLTKIDNPKVHRLEIFDSRKFWQDVTGQKINSFCYPRGYNNEKIRDLVKSAGYKNARGVKIGHTGKSPDPYWTHTSVHLGIDRAEYDGEKWQVFARKMYKLAKEKNEVFHMFGHSWEIDRFKLWNDLESFLKEING